MAHDEDQECRCVSEHRPPYLELEQHRILPGEYGGRYEPGNVTWICSNTHGSVHELLRQMLKVGHAMTYRECQVWSPRPVARYAHALAAEGYRRYTTRPTLT